MEWPVIKMGVAEPPQPENLEYLFEEAGSYGKIYLHEHNSGFSFRISFNTSAKIELEANSGYGHKTIKSAIKAAIEEAKTIKRQFK